jgi:energy-coupling factor transporter ATP-binding protein EcfA2
MVGNRAADTAARCAKAVGIWRSLGMSQISYLTRFTMDAKGGTKVQLSQQQIAAIEYARTHLDKCLVAISGPAGSGKTTLTKELVAILGEDYDQVIVSAMTNKAAMVLKSKGIEAVSFHHACLRPIFRPPMDRLGDFLTANIIRDNMGDISNEIPASLLLKYPKEKLLKALEISHKSGIYAAFAQLAISNVFQYIERWVAADQQPGVLIVDEASMLGKNELMLGLSVFSRIVLVGDENQLPPVNSEPVFWNVANRFVLTEIHRQAEGSQPLQIATAIRLKQPWKAFPVGPIDPELCIHGIPVIVWRNSTRIALTTEIRKAIGFDGKLPQAGEMLICRNSSDRAAKSRGLINNTLWKVKKHISHDRYLLENDEGEEHEVNIAIEELGGGWGIPFRFAYVLTCHNAQGSEWPMVMIHVADFRALSGKDFEESRKWVYTAATRARDQVIWVNDSVIKESESGQQIA